MPKLSLKTQNVAPLSMLIAIQLLVVYAFSYKVFDLSMLDLLKETSVAMLAIGALAAWISYIIPADFKNSIVFLRWNNALPGHRFIQLSEKDPRIDMASLKNAIPNYEELRTDKNSQNNYWYREFYRPIANQDEVAATHKSYLLYRDAAAVSLVFSLIFISVKLLLLELMVGISVASVFIFSVAVFGFVIAANNLGRRLVTTAVAIRTSSSQ